MVLLILLRRFAIALLREAHTAQRSRIYFGFPQPPRETYAQQSFTSLIRLHKKTVKLKTPAEMSDTCRIKNTGRVSEKFRTREINFLVSGWE